jgi:lipoprotein LprG
MPAKRLTTLPATGVLLAGLLTAFLLGLLAGCGGSSKPHEDPATVLKTAEQKLEDTSGVTLSLTTDNLPSGVTGVKGADGTVTSAPAFDGTLTVVLPVGSFPVPIRSVDGQVHAQIPFTSGWSTVNPSDYGAPDPALLLSKDQGIPAVLAATENPKQGGQVRGGTGNKEVLTEYTGTVPSTAVAHLIPGASGDFKATYGIASNGELRQAAWTGAFYSGKPDVTYTLDLEDYGTHKEITAP